MNRSLIVIILIFMLCLAVNANAQLASSAWPMSGHDLRHTSQSPYSGVANPGLIWSNSLRIGWSDPVIGADGTIYGGGDMGALYAFNPSGTVKGVFNADTSSSESWYTTPAIGTDGTIYVGYQDGTLYAINPDFTKKWKYLTGNAIDSPPAIGPDGTIYAGSEDGNLYAINPDGTEKWSFNTGSSISYSGPAIGSDGTVYFGSSHFFGDVTGNLCAVNSDGSEKWAFATGECIQSSPLIGSDGTIYISSGNLYAVNPNGTQKWVFGLADGLSPSLGLDGAVYVVSWDGHLYAVNPDGSQKWALTIPVGACYPVTPSIGADGTIYIQDGYYGVLALNPDGSQKWDYSITDFPGGFNTDAVIGSDGTIYIAGNGTLYAIGPPSQLTVNVNLCNYSGDFSLMQVQVDVLQSDGTVVQSHTVSAAAVTTVTFTELMHGDYTVRVQAPKWLSQSQPVTVALGSNTLNISLLNGDINGDNFVEDQDYSILGKNWYLAGT